MSPSTPPAPSATPAESASAAQPTSPAQLHSPSFEPDVAVSFRSVRKSFKKSQILPGLDLEIMRGELVTLLGPSGCGKTTTLRLLAGFEQADHGEILLDGADVSRVPAHRRDIGMVFQSYSLFPNMSVAANVDYGLRIQRLSATERNARIDSLLQLCGLDGFEDRYPHELSGGQQQRVALARALAVRPAVMLLDEPLSALDASVRGRLRGEIRSLQQQLGMTMLFVTHDQDEALAISDRIAVMNAGRIEQLGSPHEVYERPATPFVARFVGTVSEIPVASGWDGGHVHAEGKHTEVAFVRPEHLSFEESSGGDGVITERTYTGESTRIRALFGGAELFSVVPSSEHRLYPGTRVDVHVTGTVALRTSADCAVEL